MLASGSKEITFAQGRLPGVHSLTVRKANGAWKFSAYSSRCRPTSIVGKRSAVTWTLAGKTKLRPGVRRIWIDLGPGPCASGMSQNARAMKPVFRALGKRLVMIMRLRPLPPGAYTCEGIFDPPLRVSLPSRLGKRRLFDGGVYPPTPVIPHKPDS